MIRSLTDILVFKTPFEEQDLFLNKFKKVNEMFEDYIVNSGIYLQKKISENKTYNIFNYINDDLFVDIQFGIKKDLSLVDYFPAIIINYNLDEYKFEKSNIESFLNDNIKFIYNVYFDDFFIEYDTKFEIYDINKGKKVDYNNLKKIDLKDKKSKQNKQILDSMMFLYFNLMKNIFDMNSNIDEINSHLENNSNIDLEVNFFNIKQNKYNDTLIETAIQLKKQIDIFINFITFP